MLTPSDNSRLDISFRASRRFLFASSFADCAEMLRELRSSTYLQYGPKILAKLESPLAVVNLEEILDYCDGAVVGRDDLSCWYTDDEIDALVGRVVQRCNERHLVAVPASNYFMSLVEHGHMTLTAEQQLQKILGSGATYVYCNETNKSADAWKPVVQYISRMKI